jgi:predicted  nucleic acid-binding Zn-ribbon protein
MLPRYFSVWSSTGVHIGVWEDGATAAQVLREYPGGECLDLLPVSTVDQAIASLTAERDEARAGRKMYREMVTRVSDDAHAAYEALKAERDEAIKRRNEVIAESENRRMDAEYAEIDARNASAERDALKAEVERLRASRKVLTVLAEAMAEIKTTIDGNSNQPVRDIVYGAIAEVAALSRNGEEG